MTGKPKNPIEPDEAELLHPGQQEAEESGSGPDEFGASFAQTDPPPTQQ